MMPRWLGPLLLALTLLVQIISSAPAGAGAPTDQVRTQVESIYQTAGRPAEAKALMEQLFDWSEMSRRALGPYWSERSTAERTEFERLFTALFVRAYLSKIHLVDADRFQYLGDAVNGDEAVVRTRIVTKHDQEIPVNYRARLDGSRWRVYDLDVEGVSLLDNYRRQFSSIINRSSYTELVSRLTKTVAERSGT